VLEIIPPYDATARLFRMSSVTGAFEAVEVVDPCRNSLGISASFPFFQADLYSESQPGNLRHQLSEKKLKNQKVHTRKF